jgi:hypothetical protein
MLRAEKRKDMWARVCSLLLTGPEICEYRCVITEVEIQFESHVGGTELTL